MALLDRLRQELDRAGRQASRAFDEGRMRLELYRAKQSVDRFAQRFGYAVFRAKQAGNELPAEELSAHMNNLVAAEAEVTQTRNAHRRGEQRAERLAARQSAEAVRRPGLVRVR